MPRYILRLETPAGPRYMEWSTIVDAPLTYGVTLEEFRKQYQERYGTEGLSDLPNRLERADLCGCSNGETAARAIAHNRAGEGETCLTLEQIVEHYCMRNGPRPRGVEEIG